MSKLLSYDRPNKSVKNVSFNALVDICYTLFPNDGAEPMSTRVIRYEPLRKKTNNLHMRKQRRGSASQ